MNLRTLRKLPGIVRSLVAARRQGTGIVLMYHRLGRPAFDPHGLAVSLDHFRDHLAVLQRFERLTFGAMMERHRAGSLRRGAVALTFDDGYADNLHLLLPELERTRTPATIFVTTGNVAGATEFWWDALHAITHGPGTLPASLPVAVDGALAAFRLPAAGGDRMAAYHAICARLQRQHPAAIERTLEAMRGRVGIAPATRDAYRPLTATELKVLSASPWIEIGAHTVRHACLASLPPQEQRAEITDSKSYLERVLARPVVSFAYPFGDRTHYDERSMEAVAAAGLEQSCTTVRGALGPDTDRFAVPRLAVRDYAGSGLARRLQIWGLA
jgi:peptidoglycan/xylan/chitin deacetylase (PgdA/CDA1 family)